jgi:hypothetical protein
MYFALFPQAGVKVRAPCRGLKPKPHGACISRLRRKHITVSEIFIAAFQKIRRRKFQNRNIKI